MTRIGKAILILTLLGMSACGGAAYHRVRAGETLFRISKAYGVTVGNLAAANDLPDTARLEVGQRLVIPEAGGKQPAGKTRERQAATSTPRQDRSSIGLRWPVAGGVVTSAFGVRNGSQHDGIDVQAPAGAAVFAAQDGEVLFSNALRGYGNLLILRHSGGFSTVYANNQANLVRQGQRVRAGDIIARVGQSTHASGASLHFEVRRDNVARNPLPYLPVNTQVAVRSTGRDS